MNFYDLSEILQGFWPVWVTVLAGIIWFARLEARVAANKLAIAELAKRVSSLEAKSDSIEDLKKAVTAIDAKLTVLIPNYTGKKD